jgi:hypothetical protein
MPRLPWEMRCLLREICSHLQISGYVTHSLSNCRSVCSLLSSGIFRHCRSPLPQSFLLRRLHRFYKEHFSMMRYEFLINIWKEISLDSQHEITFESFYDQNWSSSGRCELPTKKVIFRSTNLLNSLTHYDRTCLVFVSFYILTTWSISIKLQGYSNSISMNKLQVDCESNQPK